MSPSASRRRRDGPVPRGAVRHQEAGGGQPRQARRPCRGQHRAVLQRGRHRGRQARLRVLVIARRAALAGPLRRAGQGIAALVARRHQGLCLGGQRHAQRHRPRGAGHRIAGADGRPGRRAVQRVGVADGHAQRRGTGRRAAIAHDVAEADREVRRRRGAGRAEAAIGIIDRRWQAGHIRRHRWRSEPVDRQHHLISPVGLWCPIADLARAPRPGQPPRGFRCRGGRLRGGGQARARYPVRAVRRGHGGGGDQAVPLAQCLLAVAARRDDRARHGAARSRCCRAAAAVW